VPCPVCRKELAIPDEGLDALPHNFFMQNLIDAREASNQPTVINVKENVIEASNQPSIEVLCEACEKDPDVSEGNIPPATMYCIDCRQKLCKRCSRAHKTMTHPHQVKELGAELNLELIKQRGSYCDQHSGKQLELYCTDYKINVCMECYAIHRRHKTMQVEKAAEYFIKSSKADVEQVSSRKTLFHTLSTQTEEHSTKLTKTVEDTERSIKQRGEILKDMVDKQVEKLLEELQTFQKTSQKELSSHKEELEFGIMVMDSYIEYSQKLMSDGSYCDVTRTGCDLRGRADELLKTYVTPTTTPSRPTPNTVRFPF